ncbi:hypothetical protein ACFU53_44540 [Streptomyces sp. NPDC057474]|uniref:hypothetical protein n=1 Tax=Streptomyces sp. NPDC057474 TaxID=3346144 RepID=UPI0036ACD994
MSVLDTLRERRWSLSGGAVSALVLLFQLQMYAVLDGLVLGCQWPVLEMPGVRPPPVRDLIMTAVRPETSPAEEAVG